MPKDGSGFTPIGDNHAVPCPTETQAHFAHRGTAHRAPAETNLAVPRTLVLSSTAPPGPPPESATDCRIGSRYVGTSRAGVRI